MNQDTLFHLVQGQQQRLVETCRREAELSRFLRPADARSSNKLQRLAEWLRPAHSPSGLIQLSDLEDWS